MRRIQVLLLAITSCDRQPYESSILESATVRGNTNRLAQFLQAGGNIDAPVRLSHNPQAWATLLHIAAGAGQKETVTFLLERGASPNSRDWLGLTPLFKAVASESPSEDRLQCIKGLLAGGADVNCKERNGLTPMDIATAIGRPDIAEFLARSGGMARLTNGIVTREKLPISGSAPGRAPPRK
jgi:ankyrin repeat protein